MTYLETIRSLKRLNVEEVLTNILHTEAPLLKDKVDTSGIREDIEKAIDSLVRYGVYESNEVIFTTSLTSPNIEMIQDHTLWAEFNEHTRY